MILAKSYHQICLPTFVMGLTNPLEFQKRVFVQDPNIKTGRRDEALIPNTPLSQM